MLCSQVKIIINNKPRAIATFRQMGYAQRILIICPPPSNEIVNLSGVISAPYTEVTGDA